jgi:CheY-like chemotaxis protein
MCAVCQRRASVLVADDDPIVRRTIELILAPRGYRVRTAADGAEAVALMAADRPDVLILDLLMPVLNGWEVQARLHDDGIQIPVVIASSVEPAIACLEAPGAAAYLSKPFRPADLLRAVSDATARLTCSSPAA